MADTEKTAEEFGIHVYKPAVELHYDKQVKAMIAYESTLTDPNERPAFTIIAAEKEVAKEKRWFRQSAEANGRTSRAVSTKPRGDGYFTIELILRPAGKTKPTDTAESTDEKSAEKSTEKSDATPEVTDAAA